MSSRLRSDAAPRGINAAALRVADIIISTTPNLNSAIVRAATGGSVSHTALYVGSGSVIEALGPGVVINSLAQALADDVFAIAFRVPRLSGDQARMVAEFARNQVGRPYGYGDAFAAGGARLLQNVASLPVGTYGGAKIGATSRGVDTKNSPADWLASTASKATVPPLVANPFYCAKVGVCTTPPRTFFCSELIVAAFEQAGISLLWLPAVKVTPAAIEELLLQKQLDYVGHLKGL